MTEIHNNERGMHSDIKSGLSFLEHWSILIHEGRLVKQQAYKAHRSAQNKASFTNGEMNIKSGCLVISRLDRGFLVMIKG